MIEDVELLRRYAAEKSEDAFGELVRRRLNFVYACALRRVGGNSHLAEDVTQQVFIALARGAAALAQREVLGGWLFTTTRNLSVQTVRSERRRHAREQKAHTMTEITSADAQDAEWERLRPLLDEVMDGLNDEDREAVLMRFSEGKSFADVGARLRLTENTARMRVERALEKMRTLLARHGVVSTSAALGVALANQAVVAAPAGLAVAITGAALAVGASGGAAAGAFGLFNFMSLAKILGTAVLVVVAAGSLARLIRHSNPAVEKVATPAVQSSDIEEAKLAKPAPVASTPLIAASTPATGSAEAISIDRTTSSVPVAPPPARVLTDAEKAQRDARQEARREARQEARQEERRAAKTRDQATERLTPLFQKLALTPEQQEKLVTLVTNDHEAGLDMATIAAKHGVDVSQDLDAYWSDSTDLHEDFLAQVHAMLGDDGYTAFLANDLAVRQSAVIEHLQKRLLPGGAQLSDAQSAQLLTVLKERGTFVVNDDVLTQASGFLSAPQMDSLQIEAMRQREGPLKPPLQKRIEQNLGSKTAPRKK